MEGKKVAEERRSKQRGNIIRKWFRIIHRDLSFFFSGVILVYAVSGILLNHKRDFNSEYSIRQHTFHLAGSLPLSAADFPEKRVKEELLRPYGEERNYTKHYTPDDNTLKVFLKGGSSMVVDLRTGNGLYEAVRKRPLFGNLNRLHYNPNRRWTLFSDIFAVSLIVITVTGLFMNRGKKGIIGRGGIELIIGILIPLLFIFLK